MNYSFMGNSASCIKKNPDIVTNSDPKSVEGESSWFMVLLISRKGRG